MKRLNIRIGGNPATLKKSSGPELSKRVGNIADPAGSNVDGLNMGDGVFKKTVFAPTNENLVAFGLAGVVGSNTAQTQGELDASIILNGANVFSGVANVQNVNEGSDIVCEMVSNGNALWENLSKKELRTLDLGIEHHDITAIKASFSNSYTGGDKGLFAPVWYGLPTPDTGSLFDYPWRAQDFRYHIFFKTIVDAIFLEEGYSVQSVFFETDYFKRWVHLFGAGSLLIKTNVIDFCSCSAVNSGSQVIGAGTHKVLMTNELSDPCAQWDVTTSTFTALSAGDYDFNFFVRASSTVTSVRINGTIFGPVAPGSGIFDITHMITLGAGSTVIFEATGTASGDSIFDANFSASGGSNSSDTDFDFSVASCLPEKTCKEFLSGITHNFNLVWFVNPVTKAVYVEPMFDYHLKGRTDTDGPEYDVKMAGWYKQLSNELEIFPTIKCPPGAYQIDFIAPFGGESTIGFKPHKDDPVFVYHQQNDSSDIDPFAVKLAFNPRGNESKDFRNPYFTALLNVDAPGVSSGIPSALPDGKELIVTPENRTFEHEPQCGIVYRNLSFIYIENDTSATAIPVIVGVRDQDFFVNTAPDGYDYFGGCYADIAFIPSGVIVPGLFTTFYKQWYAILRHGQVVTLNGKTNAFDFAGDDFRLLRRVDTGHDQFLAMQTEINDFDILGSETAEIVLVKWRSGPDSTDMDGISQNSEKIYPPRVF